MVKEADSEVGLCSWVTYWSAGNEYPICDGRWSTNFPPAGGSGSIVKNAPVVNWDGKLVEDNTQVNTIALGF